MITSLTVRWLFTVIFAVAALGAALPRRSRADADAEAAAGAAATWGAVGAVNPDDRVPAGFCLAMCASLAVMTWWSEPAAAAGIQAALFGGAALWFGFAALAGPDRGGRHGLASMLHALMAVAMIWMLTALPAVTGTPAATGTPAVPAMPGADGMSSAPGMPSPGASHGAMAPMSLATVSGPVLVVTIGLAVCCAAAAFWWLPRAVCPRTRVKDPVSASHAVMSAGMAAMLLAML